MLSLTPWTQTLNAGRWNWQCRRPRRFCGEPFSRFPSLRNLFLAGYFLQCTSVKQAKLAAESSHQLAVPRCIMGGDGSLEGVAPNRRTAGTHLEGNQLVHACSTPGVRTMSLNVATGCLQCGGGAYHPPVGASAGGSREPGK